MTAEKTLVSDHAKKDRIDRLTACLTTIGYNDFSLIVEDTKRGNNTTKYLTDTGIMIIRDTDTKRIVTGYMATVQQAIRMYREAGYERMPNGMYKRIVRNNEKYKELLDMQRQFLTLQKFYDIIIIQNKRSC